MFQIIHITGKNKKTPIDANKNYFQIEYVDKELKDILALVKCTICRAGANTIFELLSIKQPMVLIPLVVGSRGDQVLNAKSFANNKYATIIQEKDLNFTDLDNKIKTSMSLFKENNITYNNPSNKIIEIINQLIKKPVN